MDELVAQGKLDHNIFAYYLTSDGKRGSTLTVGGKSTGFCGLGIIGCEMVVDTGTSILAGPSSHVTALLQQIGEVKEDCSNAASLPTLTFHINGQDFDMGPDFYVMRVSDGGKTVCQVGISSMGSMPMWILGDPFLRKWYTVWDGEQQRVGFALAKQQNEEIVV